jgi:hypothetical protein
MTAFDPEQALSQYIELHQKRDQEIDQRPDLQRMMERGHYDFSVNADYAIRELQQEAERNGYILDWTFDREKNDFEPFCNKNTPEEYEQ